MINHSIHEDRLFIICFLRVCYYFVSLTKFKFLKYYSQMALTLNKEELFKQLKELQLFIIREFKKLKLINLTLIYIGLRNRQFFCTATKKQYFKFNNKCQRRVIFHFLVLWFYKII